jgi:hypothetical protein
MRSNRLRKMVPNPQLLTVTSIYSPEMSKSMTVRIAPSRVALNNDLLKKIQEMRHTAASKCLAYLTINQVQSYHRLFLINRKLRPHLLTHADYSQPQDYRAFINP